MTSLYRQTLNIMASQGKNLADAVDSNMVMEEAVPVVQLDWELLNNYRGTVLAWDSKAIEHSPDSTNERDVRGYPGYFLFIYAPDPPWDELVPNLKQSLRRYYNYKRRMAGVTDTDVNEIQCRALESYPQPPRGFHAAVDGLTVIAWYLEPRTA